MNLLLSLLLLASPDAGVQTPAPTISATFATVSSNAISSHVTLTSIPAAAVVVILGTSNIALSSTAVTSPDLTYTQAWSVTSIGGSSASVWTATAASAIASEAVTLSTSGGTVVGLVLTGTSGTQVINGIEGLTYSAPVIVTGGSNYSNAVITHLLRFLAAPGGASSAVSYSVAGAVIGPATIQ